MRKFEFTLQSLLGIKETVEKQQKATLKLWEAKLASLKEELSQTRIAFHMSKQSYLKDTGRGIPVDQVRQYNHYFSRLTDTMKAQQKQLAACEEKRRKCVEELVETRKEIKSLEKLRENQYATYLQDVKIEEEKAISDLVSYQIIKSS